MNIRTYKKNFWSNGRVTKVTNPRWITLTRRGFIFDDWGKWSFHTKNFPSKPGVYVFYFNFNQLYVGSTVNLKNRMNQHAVTNLKKIWELPDLVKIKYKIFEKSGKNLMIEAQLIRRLQPSLNRKK